jgi:hypothetical protein
MASARSARLAFGMTSVLNKQLKSNTQNFVDIQRHFTIFKLNVVYMSLIINVATIHKFEFRPIRRSVSKSVLKKIIYRSEFVNNVIK